MKTIAVVPARGGSIEERFLALSRPIRWQGPVVALSQWWRGFVIFYRRQTEMWGPE